MTFFGILLFISFVALIVGLVSPKLVMFGSEVKTRGKVLKRYIILIIISFIGMAVMAPSSDTKSTENSKSDNQPVQEKQVDNKQQEADKAKANEEKAKAKAEKRAAELNAAPFIQYEDYSRNPNKYEGKDVQLRGKVIQVMENNNKGKTEVTLRVDLNPSDFSSDQVVAVKYVLKENEGRILENDFVHIQGVFKGIVKYTTVMGAEVQVPRVDAVNLTIQK